MVTDDDVVVLCTSDITLRSLVCSSVIVVTGLQSGRSSSDYLFSPCPNRPSPISVYPLSTGGSLCGTKAVGT